MRRLHRVRHRGPIGPLGPDFPHCVDCGAIAAFSTEDGVPICWRCSLSRLRPRTPAVTEDV